MQTKFSTVVTWEFVDRTFIFCLVFSLLFCIYFSKQFIVLKKIIMFNFNISFLILVERYLKYDKE